MEVLADSAYGTGPALQALEQTEHTAVIKPWQMRPAVARGYALDDFTIDLNARTVTCPAGASTSLKPSGKATFAAATCGSCPLRTRCTTAAGGRTIKITEHDERQRAHRERARAPQFQPDYRRHRPMVERSIAWLVAGGNCKVRYRGVIKNNAGLHLRSAGLNLRRLTNLGLTRSAGTCVIA